MENATFEVFREALEKRRRRLHYNMLRSEKKHAHKKNIANSKSIATISLYHKCKTFAHEGGLVQALKSAPLNNEKASREPNAKHKK